MKSYGDICSLRDILKWEKMINFSFLRQKKEKNINEQYESRVLRHKLIIFYRVLICLAIIVAVVAFSYISYRNKLYVSYEIVSDEERKDAEGAIYIGYNGNVLKYSQDGAEAFNGNNVPIWNVTYEMQNPQVATCGDYAAVGDFNGNVIYVANNTGTIGEIVTKLPVSAFCISKQGIVAAVLEDENETKINIYNPEGEILAAMKCTMANSGYPVDVSLSDDGIKLGVSYIRIEGGKLKSSVAFYNFGEVGQNEIDNYVSGYDYVDTVVPRIKFINSDSAFALGDNRLVIYKGSQKPTSIFETFLTDEVKSVYYGNDSVALIFRDNTNDGKYRADVYSDKGELVMTLPFDIEYTDIVLKNESIIIYNDRECQMYRFNGTLKYDGEFEEPMILLVPEDNLTKWTLVNRDTVQSVKLK